jgi:hypothetical protein
MGGEYREDPSFTPWGPFISATYKNEVITQADIIVASIVWGLTLINATIAIYFGYKQTRSSRSPLRSVYVWMIWLELFASFMMGLECFLHLLKYIRPSKCIVRKLTIVLLTRSRFRLLLLNPFLVVHTSTTLVTDYHQSHSGHYARPKTIQDDNDRHCDVCDCNQHKRFQYMDTCSFASEHYVSPFRLHVRLRRALDVFRTAVQSL